MANMIRTRQSNPPPSIAAPDLKDIQPQLSAPPQQLPPGAIPPGVTSPGAQQQDPRQALLAQMHDVEGYAPIGTWPQAPGWWLIVILLIISLSATAIFLWRKIGNNRYRKQALKELHLLREAPPKGDLPRKKAQSESLQAQALMQLLKRTFFTAYPQYRHRVAGVYGQQWLNILTSTSSKKLANALAQIPANDFDSLLYGAPVNSSSGSSNSNANTNKNNENTLEQLFNISEIWIKNHRSMSHKVMSRKTMSNKTDSLITQALNMQATTQSNQSTDQHPTLSNKAVAHA